MLVVLLVVAVVIVGAVAVVAMGRGGEMARFTPDARPLVADIETASDVALLRPPGSMWGYSKRATDEALNAVAQTVTERDVEIATLRQRLADLQDPRNRQPAQGRAAGGAGGPGNPGQRPASHASGARTWSAWKRSDPDGPGDMTGDPPGPAGRPGDPSGPGDDPAASRPGHQPSDAARRADDGSREESG